MIKHFLRVIENINADFRAHTVRTAIIFAILTTVFIFSENILLAFLVGTILAILFLGWDSRFFIGFALIFLIFCPFLLAFDKQAIAEKLAVYAYYLLVVGVIMQLIQHFKDEMAAKSHKGDNEP